MNFVWGVLIVILGVLIVMFSESIYNFTGSIEFVESRSPGSSRGFIKLVGIGLVIIGILWFSGTAIFITGPLGEWFLKTFNIRQ